MNHYEITAIVRAEDDLTSVTTILEQAGGQITNHVNLGTRRLAYPIKKTTSAVYGVWEFDIERKKIVEINKKLLNQERVLRHLIIAGGIRQPATAAKKLSAKDLELPESLTKGMAELTAAKREVAPPEETAVATSTPEAIEEGKEKPTKKLAKKAPVLGKVEEVTANERQKKLDEKLKSILGE